MLDLTGRGGIWCAAGVVIGLVACGSNESPSPGTSGNTESGTASGNTESGTASGGTASGGTASGGDGGSSNTATTGPGTTSGAGSGTGGGGTGGGGTGGAPSTGSGSAGEGGAAGQGGQWQVDDAIWAKLVRLSPLPELPADTTNRVADDSEAAALGQMLFFDERFSGVNRVASDLGGVGEAERVSCASCHAAEGLADARSDPPTVSIGTGVHSRNAPSLINSSFYRWTNWGGRFSAQWELPLAVAENGLIMNSNRLKIAHRIVETYQDEYEAVFGALEPAIGTDLDRFPAEGKPADDTDCAGLACRPPWESMTTDDQALVDTILVNYSKAITAYVRLLVSRNAPFDAWIAGDASALTDVEQKGAALFAGKADCVRCHSGPHLSDGEFHVLGVLQQGENVPASDDGRFKDVPGLLASTFNSSGVHSDDPAAGVARLAGLTNPMPEDTRGAFRTPSLRGVALTAPYMHSGQIATLSEVIDFYDAGGSDPAHGVLTPLFLTEAERRQLLAFLEALTGDPLPNALLEDTAP